MTIEFVESFDEDPEYPVRSIKVCFGHEISFETELVIRIRNVFFCIRVIIVDIPFLFLILNFFRFCTVAHKGHAAN